MERSFMVIFSWHGPYKVDKLKKLKVFHDLICFVRGVCKNEKLSLEGTSTLTQVKLI